MTPRDRSFPCLPRQRARAARAPGARVALPIVLVLLGTLASACGPSQRELDERMAAVRTELAESLATDATPAAQTAAVDRRGWTALQELYRGPEPETIWVGPTGPRENVDELIVLLGGETDGEASDDADATEETPAASARNPAAAQLAELRDEARRAVEAESPALGRHLADLELAASYAFLQRAIHTLEGRVDPSSLNVLWFTEGRKAEPLELLAEVADGAAPGEVLDDLEPRHEGYQRLIEARERYRQVVADGGWPRIPDGDALEEGARGPRVAALRERLAAAGDLDGSSDPAVFDAAVAEAVRRFQARHGLEEDGLVGGDTLAALNVSAAERLEAIELNLERWRWMPGTMGDHYVEVNIPEYRLRAVRDGATELEMRVIVGKRYHETPVFSDTMKFIVLNPEWNIPESIATSEVVPKVVADPGYAASQGIEVVTADGERVPANAVLGRQTRETTRHVAANERQEDDGEDDRGFFARLFGGSDDSDGGDARDGVRRREVTEVVTELPDGYRLRQAPGRQNPLGQVKFMFPNEHNIYLHDTPGDHLFGSTERGFSHGCIRLERPLELADYVLRGDRDWSRERIRQVIASGERTQVPLPEELPVHLTYFTAWVDEDGRVQFRPDVYGHDGRLAQALDAEAPEMLDVAALRSERTADVETAAGRSRG